MAKSLDEKRGAAAEASRRWRANNPDRAKQVGRDAYHRRQAREGKTSGGRTQTTLERRRETTRKRVAKFRNLNRDRINASSRAHYAANQEQMQEKALGWYHRNRDKHRASYLRRKYGLTVEQYEAMGTVCQVCGASAGNGRTTVEGRPYRLFVDHEKGTTRVRGLLCFSCNVGIGYFKHDRDLLAKAIAYLERTN